MKLILKNVRFSYANVFKPTAITDGAEPKYSVSILIPKTDKAQLIEIKKALEETKKEDAEKLKNATNIKLPIRDGDAERPNDETYKGHYFVNASSKTKPGVGKLEKQNGKWVPVEVTNSEDFYSGCYGLASVNFYAYNVSGNRGIACGLNHVCKTKDGDFLGGRAAMSDDFNIDLGDVDVELAENTNPFSGDVTPEDLPF